MVGRLDRKLSGKLVFKWLKTLFGDILHQNFCWWQTWINWMGRFLNVPHLGTKRIRGLVFLKEPFLFRPPLPRLCISQLIHYNTQTCVTSNGHNKMITQVHFNGCWINNFPHQEPTTWLSRPECSRRPPELRRTWAAARRRSSSRPPPPTPPCSSWASTSRTTTR